MRRNAPVAVNQRLCAVQVSIYNLQVGKLARVILPPPQLTASRCAALEAGWGDLL